MSKVTKISTRKRGDEMSSDMMTEKVNKSKLVFAAFQSEGLDTPANDLSAFIKRTTGVDVTVSLINNLRSKLRKKQDERKQQKQQAASTTVVSKPDDNLFDKLQAVKEFSTKVGGLTQLKELVGKLEVLVS